MSIQYENHVEHTIEPGGTHSLAIRRPDPRPNESPWLAVSEDVPHSQPAVLWFDGKYYIGMVGLRAASEVMIAHPLAAVL